MEVKGNKPLSEIIAKKLFGIGAVPHNGQARMINSACKEAEKYHEQSISELKAENERLKDIIREARDYRTPMGGSMTQWFEAVTEILGKAHQYGWGKEIDGI